MKTFSDYEVKEAASSTEFLKWSDKETSKEIILLSRIAPHEGESWHNGLMAWYQRYVPPFVKGGWKNAEGQIFMGFPELDPEKHSVEYPDEPFIQVGEVLGLQKKDVFTLWVSETRHAEITPIVYDAPKTVITHLRNLEKQALEKKGVDLRGLPLQITRSEGKGATQYSVGHSFGGTNVPVEVIEAVEFPTQLDTMVKPNSVKAQIDYCIRNRDLIEKITGKPLPFDENGNLVRGEEAILEL